MRRIASRVPFSFLRHDSRLMRVRAIRKEGAHMRFTIGEVVVDVVVDDDVSSCR
jgi:hypothetical protein